MRKSREKRIHDVTVAVQRWTNAGWDVNERRVRFMNDMLVRLKAGRGLSKKQREWLDSLCDTSPVPDPRGSDPAMFDRITRALKFSSVRNREVLEDFRRRVSKGWSLTKKQVDYMTSLIESAEQLAQHGPYTPPDDLLSEAIFAAQMIIGRRRSPFHGAGGVYGGTLGAAQRVIAWHDAMSSLHPPADADLFARAPATASSLPFRDLLYSVTERDLRWIISKVGKTHMSQFRTPKYPEGLMAVTRDSTGKYVLALVVGPPEPVAGKVCYPLLVESELRLVSHDSIRKTMPSSRSCPKRWRPGSRTS